MRLTIAMALVLILAASARADWQKTKWGMTASQVKAVHPDAVTPGGEEKALLKATYSSGAYKFDAFFYFDSAGHLESVSLRTDQPVRNSLLGDLMGKYGKPMEDTTQPVFRVVKWNYKQDKIVYAAIGEDYVTISYEPLINKDNAGL